MYSRANRQRAFDAWRKMSNKGAKMADFFSEHHLKEKKINLLLGKEEESPIPAERRPWRRLVLCYSSIAFAVVVQPDNGLLTDAQRDEAKTTLYRYLKKIQLNLLEFGLVYPVTCIVIAGDKETATYNEIFRWESDQDWHRGDFTLYVEENEDKARERLFDLLSPRVEQLSTERKEPRDISWYIEELNKNLPSEGRERELGDHILDIWREYDKSKDKNNVKEKMQNQLEQWLNSQIADIKK